MGRGYLLKDRVSDLDQFAEAIRRVAERGSVVDPEVVAALVGRQRDAGPLAELTEREREILALMAEGRSNTGIGERLYLSQRTIESHVRAIFRKLSLEETSDDHRRVLAVLAYLRS
jgi:DNA-binding NarL/FixJ family response regulator